MIQPQALKPGDAVALVAPARAVTPEETAAFREWCGHKGLRLKEGRHLYGRIHQFSGTAHERATDLREAWLDPEVKAVFCARGGYGSVQLLEALEDLDWLKNPKWLVGFSDITTLHLHLNRLGLVTLHAPMAIHWGIKNQYWQENLQSLENALFELKVEVELYKVLSSEHLPFDGILEGGNLSLLFASLGTPEQPDLKGKILLVEDLDEYLYHLDRMWLGLQRSGYLNKLKAILIGDFTAMRDNTIPFGKDPVSIAVERTRSLGIPCIAGLSFGHGPVNNPLPLGWTVTIDHDGLSW